MASLSIFDDDRSATPDFFHVQTHDPEVTSVCAGTYAPTKPKTLVDHDTNNFREGLWRFPSNEKLCGPDKASVEDKIDSVGAAPPRSALKRWYWRYNSDGTRHQVPLLRKQRLQQVPSHEQVHEGYKVWNISTEQQAKAVDAYPDLPISSDQPDIKEGLITPPASPSLSLADFNDWGSRSSSLLINEMVSEEHRKSVARKQYYDRCGLLWDCASMLLENHSLHPNNLTEYEFVKLVCLQGYETFQWIATNASYLVNRAERQWHQATGLLMNNGFFEKFNAHNFLDDFLWMDADDQFHFMKSYKRLQLEAMALREGVRLPEMELDTLCMMSDEDKVATIVIYKNEALQTSLQVLESLNSKNAVEEQNVPNQVDNLHLKFLHGFGSEKHDPFQSSVEIPPIAEASEPGSLVTADKTSVSNAEKPNLRAKVAFDIQRTSEASNSTSEASNTDSSATAVSISDLCKSEDMGKHGLSPEYLKFDVVHPSPEVTLPQGAPRLSRFSEDENLDSALPEMPQLERHKVSYNDLRGLASTIRLRGHASSSGEIYGDEGSDWDFKPNRSLRKKASRLFDAFKRPFTFSSRKSNRAAVKDYFN